ncbi:MAG: hypothetical protein NTV79_00275, partial [Candidatus Aureabacteria bacterium]|nr:hypothetical protein [Candidatus Auribacterota bacterium]
MKRGSVVFLIVAAVLGAAGAVAGTPDSLVEQLVAKTQGKVRLSYHSKTGKVRFLGTEPGFAIPRSAQISLSATAEEAARSFLETSGILFGLSNQRAELEATRSRPASGGRSMVRFQQVWKGIPVMGAELIVQLDSRKNVLCATGEILPAAAIDLTPNVNAADAETAARSLMAKWYKLDPANLIVGEPELWIYNPIILGSNSDRTMLVWRMSIRPPDLSPIDELILVDAHAGFVALHFNQIPFACNRSIYDNENNTSFGIPGNGPLRTEGQGAVAGRDDVNKAYDYAGDTYNFYWSYHGRDSLDGAVMQLISTVRYCNSGETCPYANAFWNGQQMVYGQGYANAD